MHFLLASLEARYQQKSSLPAKIKRTDELTMEKDSLDK